MDFGLFFLMQRDEQWSEQAVYASGLEQMLAAEALGYHSVWIAEHHFNDYGLCPTPPVLAAFVAARTTTLRLGMGVSLLPLHHPVDLAESLAVLDVVSGGRLDTARWMSPLKMFEYMAMGRAIVSSDLPVLREVLGEDCAILAPPDVESAWIAALRRLEDADLRDRLAGAARARAPDYSWSRRVRTMLDGLVADTVP